jgi:hypothetical protein
VEVVAVVVVEGVVDPAAAGVVAGVGEGVVAGVVAGDVGVAGAAGADVADGAAPTPGIRLLSADIIAATSGLRRPGPPLRSLGLEASSSPSASRWGRTVSARWIGLPT